MPRRDERWLALPLRLSTDGALSLSELAGVAASVVVEAGGHGVEERSDELAGGNGATADLVAWLPAHGDAAAVGAALAEALGMLGAHVEIGTPESVEDGGWVEAFNATLTPVDVGRRFTIVPGQGEASPGRLALHVAPGRAFGTGHHESTRLCLEWIEDVVEDGARVRDVGTGTGILAFAAARLGASRVLATDDDPEAIEVARENLERLPERDVVELAVADGIASGEETADVVVANITLDVILPLLPRLRAALGESGTLVLAGLLRIDEPAVERALADVGLSDVRWRRAGEWAAAAARAS